MTHPGGPIAKLSIKTGCIPIPKRIWKEPPGSKIRMDLFGGNEIDMKTPLHKRIMQDKLATLSHSTAAAKPAAFN